MFESGVFKEIEDFLKEDRKRGSNAEKVHRIGKKVISRAVLVFTNIPEYRIASVQTTVPVFVNHRLSVSEVKFELRDSIFRVNFRPHESSINDLRFKLSVEEGQSLDQFSIAVYNGKTDTDSLQRVTYISQEGEGHEAYNGAKAFLKGLELINKVKKLNLVPRENSGGK